MATIWQAYGRPPLHRVVPSMRTPAWEAAAGCLQAALSECDYFRRFRSWQTLLSVLHGIFPPCFVTWEGLCSFFTVAELVSAALADNIFSSPAISY